jgi:tetratricopeptide (TPR) repeat protein
VQATLAKARKLRERGRIEQALDLYAQAAEKEPRSAGALAGRGWCYLELSQYLPAETSFRSALESDPRNADALFGMAETYRYMGKKPEAVTFYRRYLAAQPDGDEAVAARNAIQQLKE